MMKKSENRGNVERLKKLGFGKVEKQCGCLDASKSEEIWDLCEEKVN